MAFGVFCMVSRDDSE